MTTHHDGDGCTGTPRLLTTGEADQIAEHAAAMMVHVASHHYRASIAEGRYIALHYGPRGEYLLAIQLATQITKMPNPDHCDDQGRPTVKAALPALTPRLMDMLRTATRCFDSTRDVTDTELTAAVDRGAPLVEDFIHIVHRKDRDAALRAWSDMYTYPTPDTPCPEDDVPEDRDHLLHATAASCLLIVWASRYSVLTPTTAE